MAGEHSRADVFKKIYHKQRALETAVIKPMLWAEELDAVQALRIV